MKKSLFVLGVAVAALASCTQSEVLEVAEGRAIQFNTFVNNNTKAVTEITAGSYSGTYYLFGENSETNGNYGTLVFNNDPNTATALWQPNKKYIFGAYANGTGGGQIANAEFSATDGTLNFPQYEPNDANDLIAAIATHTTDDNVADEVAVSLNFKHMLSQVKFTFKTKAANGYTVAISNLKITGAWKTADGSYNGTVTWTNGSVSDYTFGSIEDVAEGTMTTEGYYEKSVDYKLVIPQDLSSNNVKVAFTASVDGLGYVANTDKKDFEVVLNFNGTTPDSSTNIWMPQYRYNYIAEIDVTKLTEEEDYVIEFTPEVKEWADASDTNNGVINPTE